MSLKETEKNRGHDDRGREEKIKGEFYLYESHMAKENIITIMILRAVIMVVVVVVVIVHHVQGTAS